MAEKRKIQPKKSGGPAAGAKKVAKKATRESLKGKAGILGDPKPIF